MRDKSFPVDISAPRGIVIIERAVIVMQMKNGDPLCHHGKEFFRITGGITIGVAGIETISHIGVVEFIRKSNEPFKLIFGFTAVFSPLSGKD